MKPLLLFVLGIHMVGCTSEALRDRPSKWIYTSGKASILDTIPIWRYSYKDSLSKADTVNPAAMCPADTCLVLKFPYITVYPLLTVYERGIELSITRGEFVRSSDTTVMVKFDDQKPERCKIEAFYTDYQNIIDIKDSRSFLTRLKKATYLTIEAEIKDNGNQLMRFYVAGLKW